MADIQQKKSDLLYKSLIALGVLILILLAFTFYRYYLKYFGSNVTSKGEYLYIKTGADFNDVYKTIRDQDLLRDTASFMQAAQAMKYNNIKPGRYKLAKGMNNRELINKLKSGSQDAVTLSFQNVRLKQTLSGMVGRKLETDSAAIISLLDSASFLQQYGFTPDNVYVMFLPNSYQMYWNGTAEKFFKRMDDEYQKFWTPERKDLAKAQGLTPIQTSVLASIVDAEALHDDEMPKIAGLYLNRLNRGMKLEADPTIIFAVQDFTIKRVLNKYLAVQSPYNTYQHTGLPPGPIMMPSINAIKAVLHPQKTDNIYMCAKDDFSGYHNFATNMAQHLINAKKFQQALNDRNIKR